MQRIQFSLASLLLLTAVVAILLSPLQAVRGDQLSKDWRLVACIVLGGITGAVIGALAGARQRRWGLGLVLGVPVGYITGIVGAVLLASPWSLPVAVVGSLVLAVFAYLVKQPPGDPPNA